MAGCEKCWSDASQEYADGQGAWESHYDAYMYFINERRDNPCTPEQQQFGNDPQSDKEPQCHSRNG